MNVSPVSRAIALGALALTLAGATLPVRAQVDPPLIRVGSSTDDAARSLLYAAQGGLFKKAGLNVEIVKLPNGAAVAAAVAGGSVEVGKGSTLTAVLAYAKGLPFLATTNLANYSSDAPEAALIVRNESPIKSVKDLIGKTIGVVAVQDFNALTVYGLLEQNGVDANQVKFLEVPHSATMAALEQARIDAAVVLEPTYSSAMASTKFRVLAYPYSSLGKHFSNAVLFSTTSYLAEHKDAMIKFNRAMREAATYVAAHEEQTKPLAAQFAGYDAATLQHFHPGQRALSLDPADLQPTIDAAAKYKLIAKAFPARDMICECALAAGR